MMAVVLTVGVFDYFHYGHLKLFEQAKRYGDYLLVAVQRDETILKYKPNAKTLYSEDRRMELVSALRIVDEAVFYTDVDISIRCFDFDVFAVGADQCHDGFKRAIRWCKDNGKKVVYLKRTEGISSTLIKERIQLDI